MDIGIALPTMCSGYTRASTVEWARLADAGPFSSVSCGERIAFHNAEMWTTLAAAAAVTERVRIFANVSILPAHPAALVAKQSATSDVLSGGRFTLGVGVGGRDHDYRSLDATFARRHQRLDDYVAQLKSLRRGAAPFDGAGPVGPPCVQPGGPPLLAAAMGPKSLARATQWADGVSGFSVLGVAAEIAYSADGARTAWAEAGRETAPTPPPPPLPPLSYGLLIPNGFTPGPGVLIPNGGGVRAGAGVGDPNGTPGNGRFQGGMGNR